MNSTSLASLLMLTTVVGACAGPPAACSEPERVADLPPALLEASGIAASRRYPDLVWVHNDSEGTPLLHALDRDARVVAEIALPGAVAQFDWEDIAIGPCPTGDCIYIGDIGDNLHERTDRAILRLAEPTLDAAPSHIERFPFTYPDGPEDAEAIFVTPDTTVFVITKGRRRPVTLFRYPPPLRADRTVVLVTVQQLSDGIVQLPDFVTGADAAADGSFVAVRTYSAVQIHRFDGDTLRPVLPPPGVSLAGLREPQGEGVAVAAGDTLLFVTETGPRHATPFLSRLACAVR